MSKIPVIIDTDPGIDDTIAIIMLAGSDKVDIKALTTTHGNVGLEGTTRNALCLRELLDIDCEVAKGAAKPMIVSLKEASIVHGKNGLAEYELPEPTKPLSEKAAWDVMYQTAKEQNGELVLVVLGPMTNVALTILKYPDFHKYVKRIYMMGGSRDYGNHSQNAEFNIWGDPHACQVVLTSGIPITMADLVFGADLAISGKELKEMYSHAKRLKPLMDAIIGHDERWSKISAQRTGIEVPFDEYKVHIYDATAAAALLLQDESLVTEDYAVICETQGTDTEGQTIFDPKGLLKMEPNVQLAVSMDKEKFKQLIVSSLEHFE